MRWWEMSEMVDKMGPVRQGDISAGLTYGMSAVVLLISGIMTLVGFGGVFYSESIEWKLGMGVFGGVGFTILLVCLTPKIRAFLRGG